MREKTVFIVSKDLNEYNRLVMETLKDVRSMIFNFDSIEQISRFMQIGPDLIFVDAIDNATEKIQSLQQLKIHRGCNLIVFTNMLIAPEKNWTLVGGDKLSVIQALKEKVNSDVEQTSRFKTWLRKLTRS